MLPKPSLEGPEQLLQVAAAIMEERERRCWIMVEAPKEEGGRNLHLPCLGRR